MWDISPHTWKELGVDEKGLERGRDSKSSQWVHGWLAWPIDVWTHPALLFLYLLCLPVSIQSQFWHPLCGFDHCNTKSLYGNQIYVSPSKDHTRDAYPIAKSKPLSKIQPHLLFNPWESPASLWGFVFLVTLQQKWASQTVVYISWLCLHCVFHKESLSLSSHQHL